MIILLLILIAGVDGQGLVRDVGVEFLLESKVLPDNYSDVWQITNFNHESGRTDSLDVFVDFKHNNFTGNYSRTINRFTRAGPPTFELSLGEHEFCVNVTPLNFEDPNLENNFVCKTVIATNKPEEAEDELEEEHEEKEELVQEENYCNCDLNIIIDEPIVRSGETIRYAFEFCKSPYPLGVSYWIEDLHGNIARNTVITTSSAKKSFTPNHDLDEKSFQIFGLVEECNLKTKGLVSSYNPKKEPFLDVRVPDIVNFGEGFNVEVSGIKDSTKRVLSIYLERGGIKYSEEVKAYVDTTNFGFIVPLHLPEKSIDYSGIYQVVVSGLDLHHEEKVFVFGVEEEEEEQKPLTPSFGSFYTRKQLFDGSLNINYLVENTFSGRIDVLTSKGNFSTQVTTRTGSLEVNISHPEEVVIGLLYDSLNNFADSRHLKLNLTKEKQENETNKSTPSKEAGKLPPQSLPPERVSRVRLVLGKIFGF